MAYKYTGRAAVFVWEGKEYHYGDTLPASFTQERSLHHINYSTLHSFETAKGADLVEAVTAPTTEKK